MKIEEINSVPPKIHRDLVAELSHVKAELKAVRGGDPTAGHEDCSDCGRKMVWQREVEPDGKWEYPGSWMCPNCVCRRMNESEAEVRRLRKLSTLGDGGKV